MEDHVDGLPEYGISLTGTLDIENQSQKTIVGYKFREVTRVKALVL